MTSDRLHPVSIAKLTRAELATLIAEAESFINGKPWPDMNNVLAWTYKEAAHMSIVGLAFSAVEYMHERVEQLDEEQALMNERRAILRSTEKSWR